MLYPLCNISILLVYLYYAYTNSTQQYVVFHNIALAIVLIIVGMLTESLCGDVYVYVKRAPQERYNGNISNAMYNHVYLTSDNVNTKHVYIHTPGILISQ